METKNKTYESPQVEIMEIEMEQTVLQGSMSGEDGNESDL